VLAFLDRGRTIREIAAALGLTRPAVHQQLRRAGRDARRRFEAARVADVRATAKRFRVAWNASATTAEAAATLGLSEEYTVSRARELRAAGPKPKRLPPRKHPAPAGAAVERLRRRGRTPAAIAARGVATAPYAYWVARRRRAPTRRA